MAEEIPDKNLFMICDALEESALSTLPAGYHVRPCRRAELDLWKAIHFDDPATAAAYRAYMTDYFDRVYASKADLFFQTCLFVCNLEDKPIATAFIWKAYDRFQTVHWFKVINAYEGRGIGRALLSAIMRDLRADDYPVYLHTQPGSYQAIKLYSDFGFKLLSDPVIGHRQNDLAECLPILERYMPPAFFNQLQITQAPADFLEELATFTDEQF
ncbi:MAG: GNAT family N-acetyltransferase [Caldilineaceae bacterium]